MIQLKTRPILFNEFLELRKWCNENNIAYTNNINRREGNEVCLFINDPELVTFARLKWDATDYIKQAQDYILSSDC